MRKQMRTFLLWLALITTVILYCGQSTKSSDKGRLPKPPPEAMLLVEKAHAFRDADALDSALVYARRAVLLSEETKDWRAWGKAGMTVIEVNYYLGQYSEVAASFPELEKSARVRLSPDSTFWGEYFNVAGAVFNALGNYEAALEYGLQEIAYFEKQHENLDIAIACNNVGAYYRNKGDYDRALQYTQTALRHFKSEPETAPDDLAWTYGNLSSNWYRKKDFSKAIAYAEKALGILDKHFSGEYSVMHIITYNDLANAWTELQEYDKALSYLQKALKIHQKDGLEDQKEVTLHNLGHVYRMMGRYPEASEYLHQAIRLYGPKHVNYGKACRHLGYIAQRQGDLAAALNWQQKALLALTDTFPYQNVLANPSTQRVNAYQDFLFTLRDKAETLRLVAQKENRPAYLEAALATYDLAASLLDSMRIEYQEGSRQFWNREARPLMESAIELAMERYRDTKERRYLEQAFRYAERSKALLLAEALRESAAKQHAGIPETLLEEEKQLKIDISFYKNRIFREQQRKKPDTDKILLWQSQILHRNRAYDALLTKLEKSYPEYYQIKYQQPEIKLAEVQKDLAAQTGLLEYFVGDRNIFVFYLDRGTAKGYAFQPDSSFDQSLEALLQTLRDRKRVLEEGRSAAAVERYAQNASALFRRLLAPVLETLPERLILIPDGKLAYLPFELLLTEEKSTTPNSSYAQLPYLLRQTTLRYEYSAAMAIDRPNKQHPKEQFAGFAPGYSGDWSSLEARGALPNKCADASPADFAPLQNNQEEVAQIAKQLKGQAFTGDQATETQFRQHAGAPRMLHLAMHGFLNDCDPLYSGLVFSNELPKTEQDSTSTKSDGILYAYEIYNLHLNAELAVLSACNTGLGKLAKGEGVISLARAFKYAGCANVLMSLWQAEDQATAQIMQAFYRYLEQGMGKDAAIRQAKLDYLDSNSRNHPFFWGAFVLIGDDQPLQSSYGWVWYAAAVVLLGAGLGFWLKRKNAISSHF